VTRNQPSPSNSLATILGRLVERATDGSPSFRSLVEDAGLDPGHDFVGASLRNIDFRNEDLRGFDFSNADLSGADFRRANITGVRFKGAILRGTIGLSELIADLLASQQMLEIQKEQLEDLAEKYSKEKTRALEASRAKSEFLANMSHELRTPLNAIIGFAEIMESGMFGPLGTAKYREYCRDIGKSARYLLEVTNDILDMSKIEAGRIRPNFEDLELESILTDTIRVVMPLADAKKLTFNAEIALGVHVKVDRRAFTQIMLNLLSNAVKFTPEGGCINVRGRPVGQSILIMIQDTGVGIPRESLKNLGRPFEQVQSQFTKSQQGSGLGLAIAKSLIELCGGTLRIRSTLGAGTIALVRLPLDERAALHRNVERQGPAGVRAE
jgi:two-component system cell cycle sensor histidine kinase PleC